MSLDNELKSIAQAYLSMHEKADDDTVRMIKANPKMKDKIMKGLSPKARKEVEKALGEEKVECPKCKGEGCDHCDDKGYHEKEMDEKMDPVDPKALKGKHSDRDDKDIDNDGDVDDSDEYLHKRRKAVSKSMKKESFDWDAILEMEDADIDAFIDGLSEEDLEQFSSEYDALIAEAKQPNDTGGEKEKLEPRAPAEKDFKDKHTVDTKDRPDANKQDGSDKVKPAAKPAKTLKDVRK